MILDLDEDESDPKDMPSLQHFLSDEETINAADKVDDILRCIDIPCHAGAHHLAVPSIPHDIAESAPGAFPPILLSNIVLAAACMDNSIRLISLPLLPPLPSTDEDHYQALQMVTMRHQNTHRDIHTSISITHSAVWSSVADAHSSKPSPSRSRSRSDRQRNDDEKAFKPSNRQWCFLLASVASTAGGTLLYHQIPLTSDTQFSTGPNCLHPIQRCYLASSSLDLKAAFNPTPFPAAMHTAVAVSVADSGYVKIMQLPVADRGNSYRGRRDSAATTDSASSSSHRPSPQLNPAAQHLITLYSGYSHPSPGQGVPRRKRILDVSWVASGGAIMVLLEDGEWGIWDLGGVGPTTKPRDLFQGQDTMPGVQGGALTRFALGGWVTSEIATTIRPPRLEPRDHESKQLIPMTPHTRKVRGERLFAGPGQSSQTEKGGRQYAKGHINSNECKVSKSQIRAVVDESITLACEGHILYISSLQALWRAETSDKGTFDPISNIRPFEISDMGLEHDKIISIAAFSISYSNDSEDSLQWRSHNVPNLLVASDYRLMLFLSSLKEFGVTSENRRQQFAPIDRKADSVLPSHDQSLLQHGQLGVDGMDRILDGMTQRRSWQQSDKNDPFLRRAGPNASRADEDGDEEMFDTASPTPKPAARRSQRTAQRVRRSLAASR